MGSCGTEAWCVGPLLNHYRCNHFFVPKTRAYHILDLAKLFPQPCQVPFFMWNKHLQEAIDKLVTTIKEMNLDKQTHVLTFIRQKSATSLPMDDHRRLTSPLHEWILPPRNPQRVTRIPTPEQRVAQRVDNSIPPADVPTPLTRVTDALAIMVAPNPITKQSLWLTHRTYVRCTRNNIPK
jgi:hypothetical protein